MYKHLFRALLPAAVIALSGLLASGAASAQTVANITAAPMAATLPDGSQVPMWGYCSTGTCTSAWQPGPIIVVPTDSSGFGSLTINFTNTLPTATSLVIIGQLGGGLGSGGTGTDVPRVDSPVHNGTPAITWPTVDNSASFTPPKQGARARAFSPEAAAGDVGATSITYTWSKLRPGTYLYETGSVPSLQAPMGLYGVVVVTQAPAASAGEAYPLSGVTKPRVPYDADITLLFSEIDPRQNAAVNAAALAHASVTTLFSDASCATSACYPPAVNYAPTYFLINGHAFDPTQPANSGFPVSDNTVLTSGGGQILLRLLNAGLRTHVPSIVGLQTPLRVVAEDGYLLPGRAKAQSQVLMPAGKTMDVVFTPVLASGATSYTPSSYPVFDRALSLTGSNLTTHTAQINSGMLGFVAVQAAGTTAGTTGATLPAGLGARAVPDMFATPANTSFNGNVLKNDINVVTAAIGATTPSHGSVVIASDGSFIYTPNSGYVGTDTFTYQGNGNAAVSALVTITVGATGGVPVALADSFTSKLSSFYKSSSPGVLANDSDPSKLPLKAVIDVVDPSCKAVSLLSDGSFTATPTTSGGVCTFTYHVVNSQGASSASPVSVTVNFTVGSGLAITVQDSQDKSPLSDYSWVIEEDTTFFHDPKNPAAQNTLATNFHKSYMPVIASGCTGPNSCGDLNTGAKFSPRVRTMPSDVALDPLKRYYISVLPGDADQGSASYNADGTIAAGATYGHTMGGVSVAAGQNAATVLVPRNALPPSQLSVFVFEDNNPTNGGVDDNEPGLGGFTINLYDTRGSSGDPAGLMTYDLSGMPFTNSLANQKDSVTGVNMCPMNTPSGTIITCPALDSAGNVSTLAGMALVKNIIPGRYDVWATPGADRAVKGETWIQVSTLEGTPANDTFVKPGEKPYWQEFGPPGFHSFIGFINPDHINAVNAAQKGTATVNGRVPSLHMDRPTPLMANLNNSCATGTNADGSPVNPTDPSCRASLNATTCYVGVNSSGGTGATVALATCDEFGNFSLKNVPAGSHSLVIWDQWLDQIIAYKALTVPDTPSAVVNAGDIPVFSWFTRIEQSAFIDTNQNGVRDDGEPGVSQIPMNVRFRDGSIASFLTTDSSGSVTANELFPLFNWYVVESDTTRYTGTGVHTVYDAGGKPDIATISVTDLNNMSVTKDFRGVLNSKETVSLPSALQVPGAVYSAGLTSRIDPGTTLTEGTQGFINQTASIDWGKRPYVPGETGGITGLVYYASTRGFDDPSLEVQFSWEPAVPRVAVNLYQEVQNADGSVSRILVDHTTTWSWDDAAAAIHCPGDPATDPMVQVTLGAANQFKCYDGQHNFNQIQPAVYDGRYRFPSANCSICKPNPANTVLTNKPASVTYPDVLPSGKYVVELVMPDGYEIVKEEDKNILIGDAWIAPYAATQFMGLGNIFIVPDQATLNDAKVVGSNLNTSFPPCVGEMHRVPDYLTLFPDNQQVAPYAGQDRPLCDHKEVNLTDQSQASADFQVFTQTPIAGHISGIMLNDAAAEFDPYNPAFLEKASLPNAPVSVRDYNGLEIARVYNDKWGTFNHLVPSTWEANVPNPSGYAPNMLTFCMNDPGPIPDPLGTLDPSTGKVRMVVDPSYNPMFSNFCYVWPSMPGITTYLDTPVLPVSAYASGSSYEPVDCAYPDSTPSIFRVDGTGTLVAAPGTTTAKNNVGPFVDVAPSSTRQLTITALGDVMVNNPAYEGPTALADATHPTVNQPKISRHYGFGAAPGTVSINGTIVPVLPANWSDQKITLTVPSTGVSTGELVITTSSGVKSIDAVTVTIADSRSRGYRAPFYVGPPDLSTSGPDTLKHPIQDAIDNAAPGDLIIVDAGNYSELLVMDRPIRLQGVGAAATVVNAAKYPNQKLDAWRTRVNNLFGLDNQGNTLPGVPPVDPLPGQEITGGILLLEPSVLATEEGAGITVLAKGYRNDGTTPLNAGAADCRNIHNFRCSNARIDGLSFTGSDAGGGIYVNGWAHNLEISNNRVFGNAGTLAAGIRVGQPYLEGQALTNAFSGFKYDENVNIHHNAITNNGTVEAAPAAGAIAAAAGGAGGGLSICAGSDGYKVTGNWVCGNYSSSDGGGIGHIGLSMNGTISNNKILFNESYQQTGVQSGGGLVIEGEGATGTTLSLGTGNVLVDANVIQGNFARAGSGGGVRLASVNGSEGVGAPTRSWKITLTNNMITNNLAAYAGAGISMSDTLFSNIVNNTIVSNDSTGIAGSLFSTQVGTVNTGPTTAVPSPAGISSEMTSAPLLAALPSSQRTANAVSNPHLVNNIVWHNRSFFFTIVDGTSQLSPSNNWTDAAAATKPAALGTPGVDGCVPAQEKYWDLGVVGDTSAAATARFAVGNTVLSTTAGNPGLVKVYCNASRTTPGLQFEPGTPFQPPFNLAVAATLDESGNFVDLHFGPLSVMDQATGTKVNGDYHLAAASGSAYNTGTTTTVTNHDIDGDARPQGGKFDIGADEFVSAANLAVGSVSPGSLSFGSVAVGTSSLAQTLTLSNTGTAALTGITVTPSVPQFARSGGTCTATLAANTSCTITVTFAPSAAGTATATLAISANVAVTGAPVSLSGTGVAAVNSASLTPTTWSPTMTRTCPGTNFLQRAACALGPVQAFTLTNTGNVPLIGITNGVLGGTSPADYTVVNLLSTCGPNTTLAPNATCVVTIQFKARTADPASSVRAATISVTDSAGTQTSTLSGTAK
ncbi:choice-of-anchor D domain-containing protein [Rhodoferax sp.]|uniref:choice-of-anchor D domain-containing protein n=1 Tax=Rhodoferax sp. TaxID=50421 RepID=UPI00283F874D|nr:choice-of-anchor D domain-containing protein [Rhodoferax sp.]MDR3370155.1 choice-of-anchor D domain-containing protein [Rhodoferax sp.]